VPNVPLRVVPTALTLEIITIEIPATSKQYSMAVAFASAMRIAAGKQLLGANPPL
jgi:hypothetical protein